MKSIENNTPSPDLLGTGNKYKLGLIQLDIHCVQCTVG